MHTVPHALPVDRLLPRLEPETHDISWRNHSPPSKELTASVAASVRASSCLRRDVVEGFQGLLFPDKPELRVVLRNRLFSVVVVASRRSRVRDMERQVRTCCRPV